MGKVLNGISNYGGYIRIPESLETRSTISEPAVDPPTICVPEAPTNMTVASSNAGQDSLPGSPPSITPAQANGAQNLPPGATSTTTSPSPNPIQHHHKDRPQSHPTYQIALAKVYFQKRPSLRLWTMGVISPKMTGLQTKLNSREN